MFVSELQLCLLIPVWKNLYRWPRIQVVYLNFLDLDRATDLWLVCRIASNLDFKFKKKMQINLNIALHFKN